MFRDLHAYAVQNGQWHKLASMRCEEAVGAVAIHPALRVVYVAHDTYNYLDLPRASVSSYALDEANGAFFELSRQPLSLSATGPRHLTVSPDGSTLFVAATAGGAYNTLSITRDGHILPDTRSIKLTGCGPHPLQTSAKPLFACFARSSQIVYSCDFGSDRVDQLVILGDVPSIASSLSLAPGTGPCHLAIHPSQKILTVIGGIRPTLSLIELNARSQEVTRLTQQLTLQAASLQGSFFDTTGRILFVTGRTHQGTTVQFTFEVDPSSRSIMQVLSIEFPDVGDVRYAKILHESPLSPGESYSLVATNVPFPYSPIATSPENILPIHLPVKI